MKVAVDAMGGDHAPREVVRGALIAVEQHGVDVILVGKEDEVTAELPAHYPRDRVRVEHAAEVVTMHDAPSAALRRKDSSIAVAAQLVKDGKADAMMSAGNTGAVMATAGYVLGRVHGIDRPAIASLLPSMNGTVVLLDVGANVDCRPELLVQFGIMGSVYAHNMLNIESPRVGILSIGEEDCKGNAQSRAASTLLADAPLNFIGNVEGRDIARGSADVVVCDGFLGNSILKAVEGYGHLFGQWVKEEVTAGWLDRIGAMLLRPAFKRLKARLDYSEYGGAILLGLAGVCIIGHGSSDAKAIGAAIRTATEIAYHHVATQIAEVQESRATAAATASVAAETA